MRPTGFCWEWTAAKNMHGYGAFALYRKSVSAHRFAYRVMVGPIPDGLVLDHLCRNRACVNPDHLQPVTNAENLQRGFNPKAGSYVRVSAGECVHGHEMAGANVRHLGNGRLLCRTCARVHSRRYKRERRERRASERPAVS